MYNNSPYTTILHLKPSSLHYFLPLKTMGSFSPWLSFHLLFNRLDHDWIVPGDECLIKFFPIICGSAAPAARGLVFQGQVCISAGIELWTTSSPIFILLSAFFKIGCPSLLRTLLPPLKLRDGVWPGISRLTSLAKALTVFQDERPCWCKNVAHILLSIHRNSFKTIYW